jgi:hypothetical protein
MALGRTGRGGAIVTGWGANRQALTAAAAAEAAAVTLLPVVASAPLRRIRVPTWTSGDVEFATALMSLAVGLEALGTARWVSVVLVVALSAARYRAP